MKIVFMGTPEFSIPTLKALINSDNQLLAVYTRKSKECNRGQKLQNTPVYNLALQNNIRILTPSTFKNGKNIEDLKQINPDLIVVVAYGLILPKELLEIPKYGCINIHPSLLPKWRGCAPMERSLMSDDNEVGVCIMKISEGLDDGDIIDVYKEKINKDTCITYLKDKFSEIGAKMVIKTINKIKNGEEINYIKQDNSLMTIADKITSKDSIIDWNNDSVFKIHRKIMALSDSTGVFINHNGNNIKILKSSYIETNISNKEAGEIVDKYFSIQCKDGILSPLILQREGKKSLDIKNFINGYRFNIGDKIKF